MSNARQDFSSLGFVKTYILPALLIFTIPAIAYAFFEYAEYHYDARARESILAELAADAEMAPEEREQAIKFFTEVPFSELVKDPEVAADLDRTTYLDYLTFRWMIRLAFWSIVSGILVFLVGGVFVVLSLRSQQAQYLSLSAGWHILRAYTAIQTLVQGVLLVAMSFWVTVLLSNRYYPKIILIVAVLAFLAVAAVIKAIFKPIKLDHEVEGQVLDKESSPRLWEELHAVCDKVGSERPDQVIVGVDDNFFVTETPVIVDGKTYHGRTLFVSLALLKEMNGNEADAVLAHEMAHFSGQDTLYSRKISPLLVRYGMYLEALYDGIARPIYYFMLGFRSMFELSLQRQSRDREFRADRIAADVTSPHDFSAAMLRISAYAKFRGGVQDKLFEQEQVLESANVSELIADGFQKYAASFATGPDIGEFETSHPFDSHPALGQRLGALGQSVQSPELQATVAAVGDARWYHVIDGAAEIERQQWAAFEQKFRDFHEATLAYRFLPASEEETEIVVKAFPEVTFEGKSGTTVIDHLGVVPPGWTTPILYAEITKCEIDEYGTLTIHYQRDGKQKLAIKTKHFKKQSQEVIDTFNHYYARYLSAVEYQQMKQQKQESAEA